MENKKKFRSRQVLFRPCLAHTVIRFCGHGAFITSSPFSPSVDCVPLLTLPMFQASFGSIKEGWLTKQGDEYKNWKKRYFVLQDNILYYFAEQKVRNHSD